MCNATQIELTEAVRQARNDAKWISDCMPKEAKSEKQRALEAKHGTPYEFALQCIASIGEISILEAHDAAQKYKHQWEWVD